MKCCRDLLRVVLLTLQGCASLVDMSQTVKRGGGIKAGSDQTSTSYLIFGCWVCWFCLLPDMFNLVCLFECSWESPAEAKLCVCTCKATIPWERANSHNNCMRLHKADRLRTGHLLMSVHIASYQSQWQPGIWCGHWKQHLEERLWQKKPKCLWYYFVCNTFPGTCSTCFLVKPEQWNFPIQTNP